MGHRLLGHWLGFLLVAPVIVSGLMVWLLTLGTLRSPNWWPLFVVLPDDFVVLGLVDQLYEGDFSQSAAVILQVFVPAATSSGVIASICGWNTAHISSSVKMFPSLIRRYLIQ